MTEGNLGDLASDNLKGLWRAEYFKVALRVGDRVRIQGESAGDIVPTVSVYKPGTDDFNVSDERQINPQYTVSNSKRILARFTAGSSGTYVLSWNNYVSVGPTGSYSQQWAYGFEVLAPHDLRLVLPRARTLTSGQQVVVGALGALSVPVTKPALTVTLSTVAGAVTKPKLLGKAVVKNGKATFTLPAATKAGSVRLIATAGDNRTWIVTRASKTYSLK